MRILLWLFLLPVLLLLCALTTMMLPLPQPFPPALSRGRNLVAAIATGLLGASYFVSLAAYVTWSFVRAGRALEPVLAPMGLTARGYMLFGRQYRGVVAGRRVRIHFVPARAVWPPQLNIYVAADIGTRLAVGRQRPLLDCRACHRLETELAELQVYAQDEDEARRLLGDAVFREALTRLLDYRTGHSLWEVYLQPRQVWLHAHPREMGEEQFRQRMDALFALVKAGEAGN